VQEKEKMMQKIERSLSLPVPAVIYLLSSHVYVG